MARKRHTAEQIINMDRVAEVHLGQGMSVTEQIYYRWRKEYGGLKTYQACKLKGQEKENALLKKLLPDLSLDKAMLQEVASGNF